MGGLANQHDEKTETEHPDPLPLLHSSGGTTLAVPHGLAAALSPSPRRDPLFFVCFVFYPLESTAGIAPRICVAAHAPAGHTAVQVCHLSLRGIIIVVWL